MSLIVSIGLSSSLAAAVAKAAIREVALALALVVTIAIARGLLAVGSWLFCASVLGRGRVCSWRCCSLVDNGASVFHDCCRVVHSVRLVCIGVERSRFLGYCYLVVAGISKLPSGASRIHMRALKLSYAG